MALAYDFDIFDIIPDCRLSDPQFDRFLTGIGFTSQREAATVALFRDPRTAEALRNAPPGLRDYFLESGFGLNTYSSGAPPGRYPASDEVARLDLIRRLTGNAGRFALPRPEDCGEGGEVFRLGAFLLALDQAAPIDLTQDGADCASGDRPALQGRALVPTFETDPLPEPQVGPEPAPPRRTFWQNRFFRIAAAAALVLGAMQLASGPALTVLASL